MTVKEFASISADELELSLNEHLIANDEGLSPHLLIAVISSAANFEARMKIRESWNESIKSNTVWNTSVGSKDIEFIHIYISLYVSINF